MSTAVKVVLWVLASVVAVLLLGFGAFVWSFSGGWDGIRPAAEPDDRAVVAAREAGRDPLEALAGPVEQGLATGGSVLGRAEVDQCSTGQNNWKIQDGWTLSCSQATVLGGAAGGTSVQAAAADVDARLQALGWVPASYGQMEQLGGGDHAQGRYEHPDDPAASMVVEVAAPGQATPYVWLGRYAASWDEGDAQPVLDAVEASSAVTVLAVVERTYFQDD